MCVAQEFSLGHGYSVLVIGIMGHYTAHTCTFFCGVQQYNGLEIVQVT